MGTFMGHVLPGSFFLVFSIWWTFRMLNMYFRSIYRGGPAYHGTPTFDLVRPGSPPRKIPLEGCLKLFFCTVGIIGELVTGINHSTGEFAHVGNGQHATMFAFFGVSGLLDLLVHWDAPLPPFVPHAWGAVCFAVEALLFQFHLHGRSPIDIVLHTLLVYTIWACSAAVIAESRFPSHPILGLLRCLLVGLQGTWFCQVGGVLYPPFSLTKPYWVSTEGHEGPMVATILFAWHIMALAMFQLVAALAIGRYHRARGGKRGAATGGGKANGGGGEGVAYSTLSRREEDTIPLVSQGGLANDSGSDDADRANF